MHTKPMKESDGLFLDITYEDCLHCGGKHTVEVKCWESSCGGYEDYKMHCHKCDKNWWVEGPDA